MNAPELLERLVAIPSPTGREDEAVEFLRGEAQRDGFRVLADPVGNFVADAGRGDRLLLLVGHVDTVPGEIPVRREGTTLWGRGAVDAKGPLIAAYVAARRHLDDPTLKIRIVGAVDEEGRSRGAKAIPADLNPEWILIGEPSGAAGLTLGYKGIVRGGFRLTRDHAHGAHPRASAAEEAFAFWSDVAKDLGFDHGFHTVSGRLDAMQTHSDGLRDQVEARFNLRLPPGTDPAAITETVRRIAESHDVRVDVEETVSGAEATKRNQLVAAFLEAIRAHGDSPQLKLKTGTSDFNIFAQRHPRVPIAAYGPGDAALDHTPNERIDTAEFERAIDVLDQVFTRLGATPRRGTAEGTNGVEPVSAPPRRSPSTIH